MVPELSVVIATHNRRDLLGRCIAALRKQTQDPASFEVVVADDGSTDGTAGALERLRTPFRLRTLRLEKGGSAAAHNAAIRVAEGEVCLFLDDDVIAAPELLAEHLAAHRDDPRTIGIGRLIQQPPTAGDWYAHAFARAWNRRYDELADRRPDWTACYGGNLSVPRAALIEVGGVSIWPKAGKDNELAFRLQENGCIPRYLPRACGVHDDQKHRGRLIDDSWRQGSGLVELVDRYPAMMPTLLGWFEATTRREIVLRRLILAMRIRPGLLARLGALIPGRERRLVWFYFVSRLAFWRGVRHSLSRECWMRLTHGVPVLMYHAFSNRSVSNRFVMPRRAFAWQMRLLRALRYRVVGFDELVQALRDNRLPPRRAAVITIDDGYLDNLEIAHPILQRHGFPATVYPVSDRLGGANDWTEAGALSERPLLSPGQVRQLHAEGVRFGAHTRTHPGLPDEPEARVLEEVGGSREELERLLGVPVTTFAYPYGRFDERAVAAVRQAGFLGACTTEPRLVRLDDDPMLIPRIEVRSTDSLLRFAVNLWFGAA